MQPSFKENIMEVNSVALETNVPVRLHISEKMEVSSKI